MPLTDTQRLRDQQANPRIIRLWQALQPLKSCVSFMNTGAHPDDETTAMLAVLALRDGIKISHACSTRGEGGQNALGTEVTKDLGVIRTREMERAAQVLGFTQYWLSETPDDTIFDFGFSKSGDETLGYWNEERTLKRFVQILRRERPDIVCPTFLDIPGQHGHHRAMTRSAFKAVELAADTGAYADLNLEPWQVKKMYLPAWSGAGDAYDDDVPPPPATVLVDGTGSDPMLGADFAQIAQWSRSYHQTQGMGHWVEPGQQNIWPLNLAWRASGITGNEKSISDDLPATLANLSEFAQAPELQTDLVAAEASLAAARAAFPDYQTVTEHSLTALAHISAAEAKCPQSAASEILHRLAAKRRQLTRVIAITGDIRASLDFSRITVRPGETFTASLRLHAPDIAIAPVLVLPPGWHATKWTDGQCEITVATDAAPGNPYPDTWFPDRANSDVSVCLKWQIDDHQFELPLDPGERISVLPDHSASLSSDAAMLRLSAPEPIVVALSDLHPAEAAPDFTCPRGWKVSQQNSVFTFTPDAAAAPGLYEFPLSLNGNAASTIRHMNYDHVGDLFRTEPAVFRIRALDIALPSARIAYIGGGSDRVDTLLRNIGMDIESVAIDEIATLDFDRFDTILIGIFAFRTRPDLSQRLDQLHGWVRAGGNLVTLYHRPWDNWDPDKTPPEFIKIGKPSLRWRVTDQTAEVQHLQPDHVLLNQPNRISADDWSGWYKERGLYFAADWAEVYQPLLAMTDPGEPALTGSLLSAEIGLGRHTHTSLILHHQLENLVPGAYRLMANLLAPAK